MKVENRSINRRQSSHRNRKLERRRAGAGTDTDTDLPSTFR